jgi:PEP-CTERM motif
MKTTSMKRGIIIGLALLLGAVINSREAKADIIGLIPTDLTQTASAVGNDGLFFTPTISISVSELGYLSPSPGGNAVALYNVATSTELASATITTSSTQSGSFYYEPVTPVALTAGDEYAVVGNFTGTGDTDYTATSVSGGPAITYDGYEYDYNNTIDLPTNTWPTAYFGPNFLYYGAAPPVPEPAPFGLLGLGAIGLLIARRRQMT